MMYRVKAFSLDDCYPWHWHEEVNVSGFRNIRAIIKHYQARGNVWLLQFTRPDGLYHKVFI